MSDDADTTRIDVDRFEHQTDEGVSKAKAKLLRTASIQGASEPFDFRSVGLVPGEFIYWPDPIPGYRGQPPQPPGYARIKSVTSTAIELRDVRAEKEGLG